ncbi:MAG: thioredoxin domain-containing protein [Alphaproteobacteria bacterium]|nr:thioredoxin domain-containing protein [Alphaproteobacteria bacterium]
MSEKKSKLVPVIVIVAFLFLAIGMFVAMANEKKEEYDSTTANTLEQVAENIEEVNEVADEVDGLETQTASFDLDAALQERVLGNPDAPVKISEYSSFSCGHCGHFHREVFKEFKEKWIDTGKAYLVFSDFPLNAPALHASLVGRCITDNDTYFEYVEDVYAKQNDWAYQTDHIGPLKAIAADHGVDGDLFEACVQNEALQEGLLDKVRAAQQQFNVNSTPSFVVNNAVTIAGGLEYPEFNKVLENAIVESNEPSAPIQSTPSEAE